jgi:transposase
MPIAMIRLDALWLCAAPVDMRTGAERLLAHVVTTLPAARTHHGCLFCNARASRVKLVLGCRGSACPRWV